MTSGESIQVENGKYARIHNDILSVLAVARFTGSEYRCLLFLFRQTYGWQKKYDTISMSQWAEGIGIEPEKRHNAWRILQGLIDKKVICVRDNGNNRPMTWGFNKYIDQWDKSLFPETVMPQDNSLPTVISQDNKTVMPQDNATVISQDNYKRKERKERNNTSNEVADKPPVALSLADQFHALHAKLRDTKDRAPILREIYILCFGDQDVPDYGRLGKVGKQLGAGYLAQRMFELVARPPNGDILGYIQGEHRNKQNRANGNGRDAPTASASWVELETTLPDYMKG